MVKILKLKFCLDFKTEFRSRILNPSLIKILKLKFGRVLELNFDVTKAELNPRFNCAVGYVFQ